MKSVSLGGKRPQQGRGVLKRDKNLAPKKKKCRSGKEPEEYVL